MHRQRGQQRGLRQDIADPDRNQQLGTLATRGVGADARAQVHVPRANAHVADQARHP